MLILALTAVYRPKIIWKMGPFLFVSELNILLLPPVFTVLARKLQVTIYEFDLMLYADSLEGSSG